MGPILPGKSPSSLRHNWIREDNSEFDVKFWVVLTEIRDAIVCSQDADQDLIKSIKTQMVLIQEAASQCTVKKRVSDEWIKGLERFLHKKAKDGFQNAQLQDLYKLLIQVESDMNQVKSDMIQIPVWRSPIKGNPKGVIVVKQKD